MRLGKQVRRRLTFGTLSAAPVLVLALVRAVGGSTPASAPAATTAAPTAPAPHDTFTPAQQKALEFAARIKRVVQASPMDHLPPEARTSPETKPVEPVRNPEATRTPVVTAIIGSGERARALIDGRVYGIGDELQPGWTVSGIDARSQAVTLNGANGQIMNLSAKRE